MGKRKKRKIKNMTKKLNDRSKSNISGCQYNVKLPL